MAVGDDVGGCNKKDVLLTYDMWKGRGNGNGNGNGNGQKWAEDATHVAPPCLCMRQSIRDCLWRGACALLPVRRALPRRAPSHRRNGTCFPC